MNQIPSTVILPEVRRRTAWKNSVFTGIENCFTYTASEVRNIAFILHCRLQIRQLYFFAFL